MEGEYYMFVELIIEKFKRIDIEQEDSCWVKHSRIRLYRSVDRTLALETINVDYFLCQK